MKNPVDKGVNYCQWFSIGWKKMTAKKSAKGEGFYKGYKCAKILSHKEKKKNYMPFFMCTMIFT